MMKTGIGCIIIAVIIAACLFILTDFISHEKTSDLQVRFYEDKLVVGDSEYFIQQYYNEERCFREFEACFLFSVCVILINPLLPIALQRPACAHGCNGVGQNLVVEGSAFFI